MLGEYLITVYPSYRDSSLLSYHFYSKQPHSVQSAASSNVWTVFNSAFSVLIILLPLSSHIYWSSHMVHLAVPQIGPKFPLQALARAAVSAQNALVSSSATFHLLLNWQIHSYSLRLSCLYHLPARSQPPMSARWSYLIFILSTICQLLCLVNIMWTQAQLTQESEHWILMLLPRVQTLHSLVYLELLQKHFDKGEVSVDW